MSALTTESLTATSETWAFGKMALKSRWSAAPTAFASAQPARVVRLLMVSPEPRAMSFETASRLAWMKLRAAVALAAVSSQLLVPVVMPKVCVPKVPFVVARARRRPAG